MSFWKLLRRSLRYYRGSHLRVILGAMICTAILVGALVIGDSVRYSLERIVYNRLGNTQAALIPGHRLFRAHLAEGLSKTLDTQVAPILQTRGIAIVDGGQRRLNDIRIIGVDGRFGQMGGINEEQNIYRNIAGDEAIVNRWLAQTLGLKQGDEFLLRIKNLDMIPKEMPLTTDTGAARARRFKVKAIAGNDRFGGFNLENEQVPPNTVFLSIAALSKEMGEENRANGLLVRTLSPRLDEAFKANWTLEDVGLDVTVLPGEDTVEVATGRIFLSSVIEAAALKIDPQAGPVLTYFVNEIANGPNTTPYSVVSAPGIPIVPETLNDDEIIINQWLAQDLEAGVGDRIRLTYYVSGPMRQLTEKSASFTIKAVAPMAAPYLDPSLMPRFPGLSGKSDCRDWDPGIPIDLDKIRDKDEQYWDDYRGAPKAFVTLEAARKMWRNRFGELTAVRYPGASETDLRKKLLDALDPARMGFVFREVEKEGLLASRQSVDFAGLFMGLSFFIIIAALLLTGLLYLFNVEKRSQQTGLYLALGFPVKTVRRLVLAEGAVTVIIGSVLGSFVGVFYNQLILAALKTVWQGVVGTSMLQIHLKFSSIAMGTFIGIFTAFCTIWLVTRKQFKQPVTRLQKGLTKLDLPRDKKPLAGIWTGIAAAAGVVVLLAITEFKTGREAFMFFFLAGTLLLVGGMAFFKVLLYKLRMKVNTGRLSPFWIGVRAATRRPLQGLTLAGLLACGLFIIFTVGANRAVSGADAEKRESGTGGFALVGECAIPVLYDLNTDKGTEFYGLETLADKEVGYVQFRVKEGDDASCLNLNRARTPRLMGVNPDELARRGAFTFVQTEGAVDVDPDRPWSLLGQRLPGGEIPAVADQTVIFWGLGKSVGDTLTYTDESGGTFKIKLVGGLANSVFQGNMIIAEDAFMQKYPSISGYRFFLVEAPFEQLEAVSGELSRALLDQGLDVIPAADRLARFNTVENTYLSIFLILGGFGLILGSIGLGIVVWRNVNERRGELALLGAVGFSRKSVQKVLLSEHMVLFTAGVSCGIIAAIVSTLPAIITPGSGIPYITISLLLAAVILNGVGWTWFAVKTATRGTLPESLRNE